MFRLGRLGSGNMVEGESWSNGYLLYRPLTEAMFLLGKWEL